MKHLKTYEKLHTNVEKLKNLISNTFFEELEEFDNIYYESVDDGKNWKFTIGFFEIYKDTIQQMEKFNEFMGFIKNGWCFKIDENENINENIIRNIFYLNSNKIENYLEKFDLLKQSNKYNL